MNNKQWLIRIQMLEFVLDKLKKELAYKVSSSQEAKDHSEYIKLLTDIDQLEHDISVTEYDIFHAKCMLMGINTQYE